MKAAPAGILLTRDEAETVDLALVDAQSLVESIILSETKPRSVRTCADRHELAQRKARLRSYEKLAVSLTRVMRAPARKGGAR